MTITGAQAVLKALEQEGVEVVFGIPGGASMPIYDPLVDGSTIRHILCRHEQGAAFMADVWGRLSGRAGVCLGTLGPGATNLVTGLADAYLDRAPVVALTGQTGLDEMHKESHQILDLVNLFRPITKYSAQIREPDIVTEIASRKSPISQRRAPLPSWVIVPGG